MHTPYLSRNPTRGFLMGSYPVTVMANSLHRHDQSIDFGIYDSDTALQETPIYWILIILMEMSKATTNIVFA